MKFENILCNTYNVDIKVSYGKCSNILKSRRSESASAHLGLIEQRRSLRTGGGASNRATENTASEESMIHRWIEEVEELVGLQGGSSFSGKVAHGGCFFGEFSRTTPRPEYFSSRKRISELINWDFSEEVCWFIGRFLCAVFGRYARDAGKNETSLFLVILWKNQTKRILRELLPFPIQP